MQGILLERCPQMSDSSCLFGGAEASRSKSCFLFYLFLSLELSQSIYLSSYLSPELAQRRNILQKNLNELLGQPNMLFFFKVLGPSRPSSILPSQIP